MQDTHPASAFIIRPNYAADNAPMAAVIRHVMPEFGADGPGFAIHDREVDDMAGAYAHPGCAYFVVERAGRVCGGGGVAPLDDPSRVSANCARCISCRSCADSVPARR
jgi:putative acetyltransferase